MQVWTATGQTDAGMDSYWLDLYRYGQLLDRLMQVWTVTGQTDKVWTVTGQTDAGMESYWID